MTIICPLCNRSEFTSLMTVPLSQTDYGTLGQSIKRWVRCSCGMALVSNPPSDDELCNYYRARAQAARPLQGQALHAELVMFDSLLRWALDHWPSGAPRVMLDLGGGFGHFAALTHSYDLFGMMTESTTTMLDHATQKYDVHRWREGSSLGLLTAWEVIEHQADPLSFLRPWVDRMAPGGLLALSTPLLDHPYHMAHWHDDPMWGVPEHLCYFNGSGVIELLRRLNCQLVGRRLSERHLGCMAFLACKART